MLYFLPNRKMFKNNNNFFFFGIYFTVKLKCIQKQIEFDVHNVYYAYTLLKTFSIKYSLKNNNKI